MNNYKSAQNYEEAGMTRRNFLRLAGLAGAAAGLGTMGGCYFPFLPPPQRLPDPKWGDIPQNYLKIELDEIDKNNLKLTDFVLKKDELEGKGIRLSRGWERSLPIMVGEEKMNPSIGNSKEHLMVIGNSEFPSFKEGLFAEYKEAIGYPAYGFYVVANEFRTKEDFEKAKGIIKSVFLEQKTILEKKEKEGKKNKLEVEGRVYSKAPFIGKILNGGFLDKNHKQEHIERLETYQAKRGLEFVAGTY